MPWYSSKKINKIYRLFIHVHLIQGHCVANKCICKTGFAGPRCDSTDFCTNNRCQNGGNLNLLNN